MTIKVQDIVQAMERYAPPVLAMPGDPVGLCLGRPDAAVRGITVSLDLTSDVIEAALSEDAGMIITHHPPIYQPLQTLTSESPEGDNLLTCAENGVALFAAHTNADACRGGTADLLAGILFPEQQAKPLVALDEHAFDEGFGRVLSNLNETTGRLLQLCMDRLDAPFARLVGDLNRFVRVLAVWPGSMDEEVVLACQARRVDLLIAGECKHHLSLMLAARGIDLIVAGHDRTEMPFVGHVKTLLNDSFPALPVYAPVR